MGVDEGQDVDGTEVGKDVGFAVAILFYLGIDDTICILFYYLQAAINNRCRNRADK